MFRPQGNYPVGNGHDCGNRLVNTILLAALCPMITGAQNSAPQAQPIIDSIPAARDVPWPGTITLSVDASDVTRGIFHVTETIPVAASGPLVLLYPNGFWASLGHRSNCPAGRSQVSVGGHLVPWKRDPVDVFAFHIDVPEERRTSKRNSIIWRRRTRRRAAW